MLREFPIEQENVAIFRAAVRAVADPTVSGAGESGEIEFLDTKTFDQDYMVFCDNFAANSFYPPEARSRMRRRREAICSHLGLPLLHGGLSYAGCLLNVFVSKASGVLIHWESYPEER